MDKDIQKILRDINTAIIKIRSVYAKWAKFNNVNYHEMLILYTLRDYESCTQKQICEQYLMPKQTINNVIKTLEKLEYIKLETGENNRREKNIVLTEKGKIYSENFMKELNELEEGTVKYFGENKLRKMADIAIKYGEILEKNL